MNLFKMRRGGGIIVLLITTALIFTFGACGDDERPPDIWDNYRNYAIQISNNTNSALIAFQDSLRSDSILGAIKAGETNHGIENNPKFFGPKPKQFKIIFITEKQYNDNKGNLSVLENAVFTTMFVFWNGDSGDNNKVYEISSSAGGEYKLQIINNSNYDVEFRVDGPSGPTLGYAPRNMINTMLNVAGGTLLICPVLRRLDTVRDVMQTIYPTGEDGYAYRSSYVFEGNSSAAKIFRIEDILKDITIRSGVAYLRIINDSKSQAIGFVRNETQVITPNGNPTFGAQQEFVIEMPGDGNNFAESTRVSNARISAAGRFVTIMSKADPEADPPVVASSDLVLKADKIYIVYVTGNPNAMLSDPLRAVVELREDMEDGPVKLETEAITYSPVQEAN